MSDMESSLISDFCNHHQEQLVCVFEYMLPGVIWDEHHIVFMSQMKDVVYAYHYVHDDNEETKEIFAIYDFFREKGISLRENPVNVSPPPFYSRVMFPTDDCGKPFYVTKRPQNIVEKIWGMFRSEVMLNTNLSVSDKIKKVYMQRRPVLPILLYQPMPDSDGAWQFVDNR